MASGRAENYGEVCFLSRAYHPVQGSEIAHRHSVELRMDKSKIELTSPHDVIFFLGAGASVRSGVPPMLEMTKQFGDFLKRGGDKNLVRLYSVLVEKIKPEKGSGPNIEEVLGLLYQLLDLTGDEKPALASVVTIDAGVAENDLLEKLRRALEAFIRDKALKPDQETVVSYLAPLLSPKWPKPVEIFSVNYDIGVELLCGALKWRLVDGFEPEWNPGLLRASRNSAESPNTVLLYKLHGSALWYRSEVGTLVKSHIRPDPANPEVRLFDGRKADQLLLYPAFKHPKESPFLDLAQILRERISQVKFVIVVGYAFGDEHLRHIFREAFAQNPNVRMILIDPNARSIYNMMVDDPAFKTVFENRVSCCPFKAEDFLSDFTHQEFDRLAQTVSGFNERFYLEQTTGPVAWEDFVRTGNYNQDVDLDLSRLIFRKAYLKAEADDMSLIATPTFRYEFLYPAAKNLALAVANGCGNDLENHAWTDYKLVVAAMWQQSAASFSFNNSTSKITCPIIFDHEFLDPTNRFIDKLVKWSGGNPKLAELRQKFKLMENFLKRLQSGMTVDDFLRIIKKVEIPTIGALPDRSLPNLAAETDEQFWRRIQPLLKKGVPQVFLLGRKAEMEPDV